MTRLLNQIPRQIVVIVVTIIISLIMGGILFYKAQEQTLRHQTEATLQAIAQLKVNTVTQWRLERFSDNIILTESPFLGKVVKDWLQDPQPKLTELLLAQFRSLEISYQYEDVQLLDQSGRVRMSLKGKATQIDPIEVQALTTAWREHQPQLSDLHQDDLDPFPHITGIAPLFVDTEPVGAILLRTDARQFLYPLLQSWPVPSESGESLIIEQSGNTVIFLNDLRHQPGSALKLHIPLTQSNTPSVMAVQGQRGLVYGIDYRGVAVVAVIAIIPNTPWFLIAKIDQDEAFANWNSYAPLILALILVLIAAVAAIAAVLAWRRIAHSYHEDLFITEQARRRGEEDLQYLETRYRTFFEQSNDGIGMIDPIGTRILDVNDAWCRMLGYTRDELLRMTFIELGKESLQKAKKRIQAIQLQGWAEFEAPMIHKDGSVIYTFVTIKQVEINEQPILLGTVRDITERKRGSALLRISQERLQLIFTSTTNGLLVADANGQIVMTNPAIETLLGYASHELIGKSVDILVPLEKRDKHISLRQAFFTIQQSPTQYLKRQVFAQHKNGQLVSIELSLSRFDSAEEGFALAMVVDITERIQTQAALEQSRENWRNLAEAMPHMVWSCSPDGHPEYLSHQWTDYTGDSDMDNWLNQLHPEDRERTNAAWSHSIQTGGNYDLEYRLRRHDGVYRWFKVRGTPVLASNGKIIKWHGCNIDIEDLKQSEQAAEQANRAKSEFLANMSHEIRTPMNAIIGLTQLVLGTPLNKKQQDYLKKVKNSSQALLGILNDILDYSKLEADRLTLEAVDFKLDDILHNLSALFSFQAEEKGIEIFFDLAPGLPTDLNGDPLRLGQILNNLVGNAVKFTERGNIHIRVEKVRNFVRGEQLHFTVQDTGIGMTGEQIGRLFRSFNQGDHSTTRKYGGTGLGLTISKHLIERMGGTITVESIFGQGSSFCFTIPLCPAHEAPHKSGTVPLRGMKTLVVDDQETSLEIIDQMLHASSFDVDVANSGQEGLAKVSAALHSATPFELILIDWKMPGMDGLELARIIREREKMNAEGHHPLVLMVTGFGREEVLQAAGKIAIDAVLEKPITPSRLFDVIAGLQHRRVLPFDSHPVPEHINLFEMTRSIHGVHLLLVEDNPTNQIVALGFLEKMGLVVDIAHHGREAVDKVAHQDYGAVLMDLQMPEMDGFEATQKIRLTPRGRTLPIIAMTAAAMLEDKQAAAAVGMDDHLTKPIDAQELAATLLKWIPPTTPISSMKERPLLPSGENETNIYQGLTESPTKVNASFELPGLDLASAVQRMSGDWSLLRAILVSFRTNFANADRQLDSYLATGHHTEVIRLVHTIKGLGKTIGATELAHLAECLEHELREDQNTSLTSFHTALQRVLATINTLELPIKPESLFYPLDRIHIQRTFQELATHLENSTTIPDTLLTDVHTQLTGHITAELLTEFMTQIELFAFTAALRTLEKIATTLALDLG
ncbi:two-component system, sensor histidine kinase and response regulator [Gammaproteobacteria bacterium]